MLRSIHDIGFFFNDTATTEIYTLSLHDALPIYGRRLGCLVQRRRPLRRDRERRRHRPRLGRGARRALVGRSEEHTSELQSRQYLVCRLLLEKKKLLFLSSHTSHTTAPVDTATLM